MYVMHSELKMSMDVVATEARSAMMKEGKRRLRARSHPSRLDYDASWNMLEIEDVWLFIVAMAIIVEGLQREIYEDGLVIVEDMV